MGALLTVGAIIALAYVVRQAQANGAALVSGDWYTGTALESIVSTVTGRLTAAQIAAVAAVAGFQDEDLTYAVAVALAESAGNPKAYNPETAAHTPAGMGSYGLWQVYLKAHPEFAGLDLYDPQTNANAAYSVYQSAGMTFRPWSTWSNGAYTAHLAAAQTAVSV